MKTQKTMAQIRAEAKRIAFQKWSEQYKIAYGTEHKKPERLKALPKVWRFDEIQSYCELRGTE